MSYRGLIVPVPLGGLGIESDFSQILEPPNSLLRAQNVSTRYGFIEKAPGSRKFNQSALPSGVAALLDWWPDDASQRIIACCKNGSVYRFLDGYSSAVISAGGAAPATLNFSTQTHMMTGGSEEAGADRKIFIYSGNDPIQVMAGDETTRSNLALPAADWTAGNYPQAGVIHDGYHWAFGNKNNRHSVYRSSVTNHEDFSTGGGATKVVNVFPGEGEGIQCAFVYKTRLFIIKYPFGLYYIDNTDPTAPAPAKLSASFGASSAHCAIQLLDDMLIGNSSGSITSLKAVFSLGEVEQGDILKSLKCLKYMQENTSPGGTQDRQAIYYEDKKQALFAYRGPSSFVNDRILVMDFHHENPKVIWYDKDQPNCFALVKDFKKIGRPYYGAEDGFIYEMDQLMRNVGGNAINATFDMPHIDFSWVDKKLQELDKHFDFLGLSFEPQGNWDIAVQVFIDGFYSETVNFKMSNGSHLDGGFTLDRSRLGGPAPFSRIMPLHGMGKRISLRFTQSGVNQNFKISAAEFYFRPGGQNSK